MKPRLYPGTDDRELARFARLGVVPTDHGSTHQLNDCEIYPEADERSDNGNELGE